YLMCFFFRAEDGIRDRNVTGVQTCALPISQDYSDTSIDLTQLLIRDELATFIVRVSGESMHDAGIYDGDELIVDRSLEPRDGNVVIAVVDGEMTVKRLRITTSGVRLQADNADYPDVEVAELSELMIWGVATRCLHRL